MASPASSAPRRRARRIAAPAQGHGQRNMRFRAARIPAQLHIGRRDGWTVVELVAEAAAGPEAAAMPDQADRVPDAGWP